MRKFNIKKICAVTVGLFVVGAIVAQRPDHVNNALKKFFPPVFNQSGGSCGSAQAFGYIFTYEMANYRNLDASLEENQYPSHFTWLTSYQNVARESVPQTIGIPNVPTYGGRTYSKIFGVQDCSDDDYGWMQGYEKWHSAMFNRISKYVTQPSVMTDEGREMLKDWLWNHSGDESFNAGSLAGVGVAMSPSLEKIPNVGINEEIGVVGKQYVTGWSTVYNHGITVCGYDDRIEFDLNGNGVYGEEKYDEKGAWILCNSWGNSYGDNGFIYCPYRYSVGIGLDEIPWKPETWYVRKDYTPKRVMKIKMDYTHRSELWLSLGISADTAAQKPAKTIDMDYFKNTGDGANKAIAPEMPMLGRWADGIHDEPMEFGYDVTDLSEGYDWSQPLKYFFIIDTQKRSKLGSGHVYTCSLMDYSYDEEGIEIPCTVDTVVPIEGGKKIMVTVIAKGETTFPPLNVALSGNQLTWQKPDVTSLKPVKYYIYMDGVKTDSVNTGASSYTVANENAIYSMATVYQYKNKKIVSPKSNSASKVLVLDNEDNKVLKLNEGNFIVPNLFTAKLTKATIEFWIKPNSHKGKNQYIGNSDFFIHTNNSGQVVAGWDETVTDEYAATASNTLKDKVWQHVVVTVDNNVLTIYVNGMKKKSITSAIHSGIPAMGDLMFGNPIGLMDGTIDEVRVWNSVRQQTDIYLNKDDAVACPIAHPNLICYLNMDQIMHEGQIKIRDYAQGNHALLGKINYEFASDNTVFKGSVMQPSLSFKYNDAYAGVPVKLTPTSMVTAVDWTWMVENKAQMTSEVQIPTFTFNTEGNYAVSLKVTDNKGKEYSVIDTVKVKETPSPELNFLVVNDFLYTGDQYSFVNLSKGTNMAYTWLTPGAEQDELSAFNGSAVYSKPGKYEVTLKAMVGEKVATLSKTINVLAAPPVTDFQVSPNHIILGESTNCDELCSYNPQEWTWVIKNEKVAGAIKGGHSTYKPTRPGVYDVYLQTTNEYGSSELLKKRALLVSNADAGNCIQFTGREESIEFTSPIKGKVDEFTIDFWMQPIKLTNSVSFKSGNFKVTTSPDGEMDIYVGETNVSSFLFKVIANEWHHYTIRCVKSGTKHYIAYMLDSKTKTSGSTFSNVISFGEKFVIGGENVISQTLLDEFRFWNKNKTDSEIKACNNAPITDIETAKNAGLKLYYDFNQSTGDIIDRTGNGFTGIRVNFGPEGDAFDKAAGVFVLDYESSMKEDVSSKYLTNYKEKFKTEEGVLLSPGYSGTCKLLTNDPTSTWQTRNEYYNPVKKVTTGFHVDPSSGRLFARTYTSWGFESWFSDMQLFQTTKLPAGYYTFTVGTPSSSYNYEGSYMEVAKGREFYGDADFRNKAIAYSELTENNSVDFVVAEESEITVGLVLNCSNINRILGFSGFTLTYTPMDVKKADNLTNVYDAVKAGVQAKFSPVMGGIKVICENMENIRIYTVDGKCVFNDNVEGVHILPLQPGIYTVNGMKLEVRS
ncbi:MAG: DUF5013 domain-containing protein [Prevotellaceae bacterium]|nr:DUF5013 domain-containing protein [Candidatus Faecinaster equi]